MPLRDGDEISVYDGLKDRRYVMVSGAMMRTGQFELARGEGISNLIVRAGGFKPDGRPHRRVPREKGRPDREVRPQGIYVPRAVEGPFARGRRRAHDPLHRDEGHRRRRGEPAGRVPVQRRSQHRRSTSGWREGPRRTEASTGSRSTLPMERRAAPTGTRTRTGETSSSWRSRTTSSWGTSSTARSRSGPSSSRFSS